MPTKCEICNREPYMVTKRYGLIQDHNHTTGQLRGMICQSCNRKVGIYESQYQSDLKDPLSIEAYLDKWEPETLAKI